MLEILKDNVLIAYQQLEQYQLDRYGRGVVSAIDRNRDMVVIKTAQQCLRSWKINDIISANFIQMKDD